MGIVELMTRTSDELAKVLIAGSEILNAYQDIEEELNKDKPNLKKIRKANNVIGMSVLVIVPG